MHTRSYILLIVVALSFANGGLHTHICIQLPHKAGKVVVLKVLWKQLACKLRGVPNHKAVVGATPRNHAVCGRIIHHFIGLCQKRGRGRSLHEETNESRSLSQLPTKQKHSMHFKGWLVSQEK